MLFAVHKNFTFAQVANIVGGAEQLIRMAKNDIAHAIAHELIDSGFVKFTHSVNTNGFEYQVTAEVDCYPPGWIAEQKKND